MKKLPQRVFVEIDTQQDASITEDLLVWRRIQAADCGRVGVYVLEEELDKREVVEVRRQGTKSWFKPSRSKAS